MVLQDSDPSARVITVIQWKALHAYMFLSLI